MLIQPTPAPPLDRRLGVPPSKSAETWDLSVSANRAGKDVMREYEPRPHSQHETVSSLHGKHENINFHRRPEKHPFGDFRHGKTGLFFGKDD